METSINAISTKTSLFSNRNPLLQILETLKKTFLEEFSPSLLFKQFTQKEYTIFYGKIPNQIFCLNPKIYPRSA
ncbi:hypothetical protein GDO81_029934 [Engystomops pustulosus]|uniref:Uncharacterized protein n=1 Tax=Engystomops pustulosus TaxID=76066 RepID=A0AAV6ZTP8_ENGPU|nr:hypothetical protein GDO81_029934 [Engystomops pustulosus]